MQERQVTAGNATRSLPAPYFVLATQNPIEHEGTYPLPEAQLDRFFFKLVVPLPSNDELVEIALRTTGADEVAIRPVASGSDLLAMARLAREVPIARHVLAYAARLLSATHPGEAEAPEEVSRFVRWGSSPARLPRRPGTHCQARRLAAQRCSRGGPGPHVVTPGRALRRS